MREQLHGKMPMGSEKGSRGCRKRTMKWLTQDGGNVQKQLLYLKTTTLFTGIFLKKGFAFDVMPTGLPPWRKVNCTVNLKQTMVLKRNNNNPQKSFFRLLKHGQTDNNNNSFQNWVVIVADWISNLNFLRPLKGSTRNKEG
jgi:hypothetical protein